MEGNMQKPFSNNQVKNNKPNVPQSINNVLTGHFQGSMNGGHNKTQTYFYVMANQYIDKLMYQEKIRILTPYTPPYMKLNMTVRVYNVPHVSIWKDYEKFIGQKGGSSTEKIKTIPNLGGERIRQIRTEDKEGEGLGTSDVLFTDTANWRDHMLSPYIPRIGNCQFYQHEEEDYFFPNASILPMRGRAKIYNEFERNKELDEEIWLNLDEDKSDIIYLMYEEAGLPKETYKGRAKNNNCYYSDFRTELQGLEASYPPADMSADTSLENWMANFENLIAESRSEAENANLNENELIAKLRGSILLTEGRVTKIAEKTFPLNYSSITQTNYNDIANVNAKATGTQGAYSYTEVNFPILEKIKFKEDGIVHIIATVWAEKIYESAWDRMDLNINVLDLYRPDMIEAKKDVLYALEVDGTTIAYDIQDYEEIIGFKRKYNEYFKLRNTCAGDLTNNFYYNYVKGENGIAPYVAKNNITLTNNTYQFNLTSARYYLDIETLEEAQLNYWQDYTDLLINKNLAYKESILTGYDEQERPYVIIPGQNQIDFVGNLTMITSLPIDGSIAQNYTQWGEH